MATTSYFTRTLAWVLISPWIYGYHIACLNQLQIALTCASHPNGQLPPGPPADPTALPLCIPMTSATFGLVTSIFTIGGLLGSLASNHVMHKWGRKGALQLDAVSVLAGSFVMTLAWSPSSLIFGRFLIGLGCGMGLCVVPVYLSEIAPESIKGSVGVLNQVSIVIGVLLTQVIGIFSSSTTTQSWRLVFFISGATVGLQLLASPAVADTPSWLTAVGRDTEAKEVAKKLAKDAGPILSSTETRHDLSAEEQALLSELDPDSEPVESSAIPTAEPLTMFELIKVKTLRQSVIAVVLVMFSQQISGINAVIFYSTDILSHVVPPAAASYISLGIAALNALMTFPAITLIQRLGRRQLLLGSMLVVFLSLLTLGFGLNNAVVILSSTSILIFVGAFAIGLGPVPYVLIGELVPFYAASPLSSMALSLSWITNFIVGIAFLPLRDWLSTPDGSGGQVGEGRIFYVFAALFGISAFTFSRLYK